MGSKLAEVVLREVVYSAANTFDGRTIGKIETFELGLFVNELGS